MDEVDKVCVGLWTSCGFDPSCFLWSFVFEFSVDFCYGYFSESLLTC